MGNYDTESRVALVNRSPRTGSFSMFDIEIDRGCTTSVCSRNTASHKIPLYGFNELPEFLKWNPYVFKGYRAFLPFSQCWQSLFLWSNETINIWSHLLGFSLFFMMSVYDNLILIPKLHGVWSDHIIMTLGLLCYQFCMLCSAGYHLFACHSERACHRWLAIDLAGIAVGLIGCYLPAVYYAFYCGSIWRDVYMIIITFLSVWVLYFQLHPRYLSSSWNHYRVLMYCGLVAYGIIPTIHWINMSGGWQDKLVQMFIPKVAVMYLLGFLAFFFYITKFPERCFPGRFDFVGSSHQLWHIIVVVAFYWWHDAGQSILHYRMSGQCYYS